MSAKLTILGCGNSSGTPSTGNYWGACDPNEPKNRRNRCSVAIQHNDKTIIIDTGADFRQQSILFNIINIDAVLYTHSHSDHCHGIDDLRPLFFRNNRRPIDCYASKETLDVVKGRFHYLFDGGNNEEFYPPILNANELTYGKSSHAADLEILPFEMDHGSCNSTGYRIGDLSYCVDVKSLNNDALNIIRGSRTWIVDAAAYHNENNSVHACLETIYEYQKQTQCENVIITSLSSQMDYKTLTNELPENFYPAYDGMTFDIIL